MAGAHDRQDAPNAVTKKGGVSGQEPSRTAREFCLKLYEGTLRLTIAKIQTPYHGDQVVCRWSRPSNFCIELTNCRPLIPVVITFLDSVKCIYCRLLSVLAKVIRTGEGETQLDPTTTTKPCGPRSWIGRPSDRSERSFVGATTPSGSDGCRSTWWWRRGLLPLEVVLLWFLYWRLTQALQERDGPNGSTLFHHLGPTPEGFLIRVETLEFLVRQWPGSLQQRNSIGALPFHVAVANRNLSAEVVRFLFEQHPPSIRERGRVRLLAAPLGGPVGRPAKGIGPVPRPGAARSGPGPGPPRPAAAARGARTPWRRRRLGGNRPATCGGAARVSSRSRHAGARTSPAAGGRHT
jgi:hypothetical protein